MGLLKGYYTVAETLPEKKISTFVVRMHTYIDEHGRTVDEKLPVVGEPPIGFVRFTSRGKVTGRFTFGSASKNFDVPLPRATTVQEAFARIAEEFPAAMRKAGEELKVEVMEQLAERTGQQAIAQAPANILDLEGNLRGMPALKKGRSRQRSPLDL